MAKCCASDAAVRHRSNAVQICGAAGCIRGCALECPYRDAEIMQVEEDTSPIKRICSRAMC